MIDQPEEVHRHSGWLIPLGFLIVILVLSALFLLYDLRPGPGPRGGRSENAAPVQLTVRGMRLAVPANYIDNSDARGGGEQDSLHLSALLPDLRGFSRDEARLFASNAPDSPVVRLVFKGDENDLDAAVRLERIYRPYIQKPGGSASDFGLTRYTFRADSGYARQDLFAGMVNGRMVLFLCERAGPDLASPSCQMTGRLLAKNLSLSYRFKRAYLSRWRETVGGVDRMVTRFQAGG